MKKLKLFTLIPAFLLSCSFASMTTLKDISKPYAGTYECERLILGEEDITEKFKYIEMQLLNDETYRLRFLDAFGIKGEFKGRYSYDNKKETLTIEQEFFGENLKRTFPVKNGEFCVTAAFCGKTLCIKFKMR